MKYVHARGGIITGGKNRKIKCLDTVEWGDIKPESGDWATVLTI